MKRVVIVGGGITGASAAYELLRVGGAEVTLVETRQKLGGNLRTERVDECVIDAGPDSWVVTKPHATALAKELGLEDQLMGTNEATRRHYLGRAPPRAARRARARRADEVDPDGEHGALHLGREAPHGDGAPGAAARLPRRRRRVDRRLRDAAPRRAGQRAPRGGRCSAASTRGTRSSSAFARRSRSSSRPSKKYAVADPGDARDAAAAEAGAERAVELRVPAHGGIAQLVDALEARLGGATVRRGERGDQARARRAGRGARTVGGRAFVGRRDAVRRRRRARVPRVRNGKARAAPRRPGGGAARCGLVRVERDRVLRLRPRGRAPIPSNGVWASSCRDRPGDPSSRRPGCRANGSGAPRKARSCCACSSSAAPGTRRFLDHDDAALVKIGQTELAALMGIVAQPAIFSGLPLRSRQPRAFRGAHCPYPRGAGADRPARRRPRGRRGVQRGHPRVRAAGARGRPGDPRRRPRLADVNARASSRNAHPGSSQAIVDGAARRYVRAP